MSSRLRNTLITGMLFTSCLTLAACGSPGGSGQADGNASSSPQDAALNYARCLRTHGIQVPDPDPVSGQLQLPASAKSGPSKLNAALQACQRYAGKDSVPGNSPANNQQVLSLARCLRQHGVNVADPQPGQNLQLPSHSVTNPKVQQAIQICERLTASGGQG